MDAYAARYHAVRAPRKLRWLPHLGTVALALVVGSTKVDFVVSPAHAAVLCAFRTRPRLRISELGDVVGMKHALLRRKALFWVSQGEGALAAPTTPAPWETPTVELKAALKPQKRCVLVKPVCMNGCLPLLLMAAAWGRLHGFPRRADLANEGHRC
jgi:hypothetical protein